MKGATAAAPLRRTMRPRLHGVCLPAGIGPAGPSTAFLEPLSRRHHILFCRWRGNAEPKPFVTGEVSRPARNALASARGCKPPRPAHPIVCLHPKDTLRLIENRRDDGPQLDAVRRGNVPHGDQRKPEHARSKRMDRGRETRYSFEKVRE